jgi:hypothetical protein
MAIFDEFQFPKFLFTKYIKIFKFLKTVEILKLHKSTINTAKRAKITD